MASIKGIQITLYERRQSGTDNFNAPVYTETPVTVENVLISPASSDDIVSESQLHGRRAEYELYIPKDDTHIWEDRIVEFFGEKWRTIGTSEQWMAGQLPLHWNKRIKVERYG